jgi:hypothetical protein
MLGGSEECLCRCQLNDLAYVHHGDAVAHMLDDREVVRDKQVGEFELRLEIEHQIQDLGLDRDVEGRDRLVGYDQTGVEGESTSDSYTLTLAATKGVREAPNILGPESDKAKQFCHPLNPRLRIAHAIELEWFADDVEQGLPRIQG